MYDSLSQRVDDRVVKIKQGCMAAQNGKLEEGLLQAMKAIDNQLARAMQRTPAERDVHGVQKWEPYETRVEHLTAFILNHLGDGDVTMDSLFVLSQAFTKALRFASEDLGADGLGEMRTAYCIDTMEKIERDTGHVLQALRAGHLT
jgi:hypothetical protein